MSTLIHMDEKGIKYIFFLENPIGKSWLCARLESSCYCEIHKFKSSIYYCNKNEIRTCIQITSVSIIYN